jgi:hypothetical protein
MAQIIKHRRGSLESVSSATKRSGELLVVTGSAGITATNSNGLLFVGIDGSTVTAANKFLQGTSVPDLTGASYDTSIDGIPFYDTSAQKLYILNKGGNVEVKATANTAGTGIVSSSAQVDALGFLQVNGDSVVSGSSQISLDGVTGTIDDVSGFTTFSSSVDSRIDSLESFSSSLGDGFATDAELTAVSSAFDSTIKALDTDDVAEGSNLYYTETRVKNKLSAEGVISSSIQVNADSITNFDSNVKDKMNADGVISGSSQVQIASVTGFTAFSSSVDSRVDALEEAVGEGSNIDGRLTALETFSGSTETSLAAIHTHTASVDSSLTAIHSYTSSLKDAISVSGNDLTVLGNLQVQGTTTTVDSTTVSIGDNIIELNGTGAAFGGLLIGDVTAPNANSGSLLWDATNDYWIAGASGSESKVLLANGDGVVSGSAQVKSLLPAGTVSGSSQVDADSITNFDSNVLSYIDSLGVVSGSSQVTISDTTGYNDFSSSIATAISASVAASDWANLNGKPAGIVSGSSQVVDYLDSEDVNLGGISGSSLDITGNVKIDGNLTLGGNITIGDATSDTISFGGEVSSDIVPSNNSVYALGTNSNKFLEVYATDFFGTTNGIVNATNGVISGSSQLHDAFDVRYLNTNGDGVHSGSAQVVSALLNQATDFGTGRVSGDDFGNVDGSSTITGSFVGDGSGLTGLATNLIISGTSGNDSVDLLNDALTFAGGTAISVAVTDNTITVNASDASTSAKGIASFDADDFSVVSGNVSIKSAGVRAANLNADVVGTGIELNGVDNSIEVSYGSTSGTAVEGNTSLTVQGTSNEIEVTSGNVTLGAGGTVTIGLPDSVTIATASIQDDLTVGGNVEITGNLSVLGTTTTINSTTVELGDNIIELNGAGNANGGLLVKDLTAPNTVSGSLLWDSTNDFWKAGALGSEKELARLNSAPTANTILKANADGLLVDSVLTDDGTDATFSGDVIVDGFGSNANGAFLYADASNTLTAIAPSNAGDVIQWNGSSFVASNELDGGTF